MPVIDHARYTCGDLLGEGAQGIVVRVIDRERPSLPLVAKTTGARASGVPAHLEGEFALLARLRAPGLARVHDFARDTRGVAFLVEDFVEGIEPSAWVSGDAARLVTLAAELAETLAALHDAGFVHGDVKPANVRVPEAGRAMLLDLGAAAIVRSVRTGTVVFTEAFAAPELRAGAAQSVSTDLYALGATLWACATGTPPAPRPSPLRDRAPWVPPSVASAIELLVSPHPADRPRSAGDLLAALGRSAPRAAWEGGARDAHVREIEIARLLELPAGPTGRNVVYVTGPSGAGKSHLVREVTTRALLMGRPCRHIRFPTDDAVLFPRLVAYLRGDERAAPWQRDDDRAAAPLLLVLDDLHVAPAEVSDALDAFRCMMHVLLAPVVIVATARTAAAGASAMELAGLERDRFAVLCSELGVPPEAAPALHRETGGLPGWAVASLGRVPLTRDAVLARLGGLDAAARDELAVVATLGGSVPADLLDATACAASFVAGLLERDRDVVRLASAHLARDLAEALTSFAVSDRAAELALGSPHVSTPSLVAVGGAPSPPARRTELFARAAEQARREGARSIEIEALLALAASTGERTAARLSRLERLTRDAGTSRAHPQVLAWLEEAARTDATVGPLAARRRAEERARAGAHDEALEHAGIAIARAKATRDAGEEAYAFATKGAVRLFAADWAGADDAFDAARTRLAAHLAVDPERVDREEIARLEHNVGVVALYRGRIDVAIDAFDRSVTIKRALGDRAGIRACLLNSGLALARAHRHDDAERALVEATALAETLGQAGGRAWCLAARADLAVRRGRARDAERLVAEAHAIGDAVPAAVRADLVLLRAEIALLEGDGSGARAALASLDADLRASDALVDARAHTLEARGLCATLPADRRGGARAAIRALRRARTAGLADAERDAVAALHAARGKSTPHTMTTRIEQPARLALPTDAPAWELLSLLAREPDAVVVVAQLAALVLGEARGERAIIATLDAGGQITRAWGVDLDGLPIAKAEERIDGESVAAARRRGALVYQPDVVTKAGTGSRIVVAGFRSVVVVEHRFVRAAFDHVNEAVAGRWGVIADLAVRVLDGGEERAGAGTGTGTGTFTGGRPAENVYSTALPRKSTREYPDLLGRSPALRRALAQLDAAVDTDLPVVVHGETGTGKELFARALHDHGTRSARPFVAVNCAAISDALFEAELFGHARGAFTGADRARPGLLARAEGGTLLLDELGDLPLAKQATLLRALETRRYRAVGSDDERTFDVRIIAATNRDLDAAVEDGSFRRDLLYRLRVLEIAVPPLRDRAGDIELLLRHFLVKAGSRGTPSPAALAALAAYPFPGNVRELLHISQRLAAAGVARIDVANLPRSVRLAVAPLKGLGGALDTPKPATPHEERAEVEGALARTEGNISRAAVLLGLSRHGLKKRMLRLGLRGRAAGEA